eukprot:5160380-Amphidinium_carterae.4
MASFGWMVASADISTAFLYAALHQDDVKLGFTTVSIGFFNQEFSGSSKSPSMDCEHPLAWEREQDKTIATLDWKLDKVEYCLQLAAACVWKIVKKHQS